LDCQFGEIKPNPITSIQIPRVDLEQYRYDGSTSKKTPIKYPFRIEENQEENLLQKMHISKNTSQINREIIKLPEFNNQSIRLGHILPMGIQNIWRNKMVAKNHQIQPSSSYFDNIKSSSSDYDRCVPNSMGSDISSNEKKRNKEIISRREKSSNIIGKRQSILPHKFNNFQVELYGPNRSKQKSKIEEGLSDSSTEMVKLDEESKFKSKRINSDIPSSSSLSSSNKKTKIQIHPYQNKQYNNNIQHQQKI
jgi:hypothetical protein